MGVGGRGGAGGRARRRGEERGNSKHTNTLEEVNRYADYKLQQLV